VSQQVKAGLGAIRDFLSGRSSEAKAAAVEDKATREVVAAELLATMSGESVFQPFSAGDVPGKNSSEVEAGYSVDDAARVEAAGSSRGDAPGVPRFDGLANAQEAKAQLQGQMNSGDNSKDHNDERARARQLFLDHGYFDEAVLNLRAAESANERATAAQVLGLVGSKRGAPHLVAAMFDDDPEVRRAAEEALSRIGEANVPRAPLDDPSGRAGEQIATDSLSFPALQSTVPETISDTPVASEVVLAQELTAENEVVRDPPERSATHVAGAAGLAADPEVIVPDIIAVDSVATSDEELLFEEADIRERLARLQLQLVDTVILHEESEQEIAQSNERERRLRTEAAARRIEEEEIRKRADEKAERRWAQEREALLEEQLACAQAEADAQRFAELETRLRLKAADLKQTAERLARQREDNETTRLEAEETARRAAATRARNESRSRHDEELNRLRNEEEWLRAKTDETMRLHAEVAAARKKAEAEAEALLEVHARMQAAEQARAQAEVERAQLEAEIKQRVETAWRQLEDTRRRGEEEQERLEGETRRRAEAEQQRRIELDAMKARAEADSRELAKLEQQTLAHLDSLRIADAEARKRIADAEVRRHAAEDAYRVVAETVQRVEAEAHARAQEEGQMRAKLEAERRAVAIEAQSREEQEGRVREEIEMFHRLEEQARPRIEQAILQRAEAEARLHQQRERFKAEEKARHRAEEELSLQGDAEDFPREQSGAPEERESHSFLTPAALGGEQPHTFSVTAQAAAAQTSAIAASDLDQARPATVAPAVTAYLNSVDPYKRAAALAELARSRPPDAFALITNCFDDHSAHVRNAAARALRKLDPSRTVDLFNRALEEASPERRRNIGGAIAASGVATEAVENLVGENREDTYGALAILFVMAKTGEVEPLERALAEHPDDEIGRAVAKLLALSGHR
jgi:hypothetical protein